MHLHHCYHLLLNSPSLTTITSCALLQKKSHNHNLNIPNVQRVAILPQNHEISLSLSLVAKQLTYLLVLQLDAHHSEGVVGSVVVDVDAAESLLSGLDGHPLLTGVIVDHD